MQSESREEKRTDRLFTALHVAGLAVLAGACIVATAGSPGSADRHARAPVAGAAPRDALPAGVPLDHLPHGKG